MQGLLAEAQAAGADNVAKLERAVAKNSDRVARAQAALTQARQTPLPGPESLQ
ncbi:hypothetical protein [Marinobacter sp. X15-166B]|uniref:hypothetical protein n=1 Tax=Marinobacter sp. X15-166B TaxID=1897620 RepID=UPI002ADFF158|nr:hypothetical protein [Marinobacter sp. X15-166B]